MTPYDHPRARWVREHRASIRFARRVAAAAAGTPLSLAGPGQLRYWPSDWPGIDPACAIIVRNSRVFAQAAHHRRHEPSHPGGVPCLWTLGPIGWLP